MLSTMNVSAPAMGANANATRRTRPRERSPVFMSLPTFPEPHEFSLPRFRHERYGRVVGSVMRFEFEWRLVAFAALSTCLSGCPRSGGEPNTGASSSGSAVPTTGRPSSTAADAPESAPLASAEPAPTVAAPTPSASSTGDVAKNCPLILFRSFVVRVTDASSGAAICDASLVARDSRQQTIKLKPLAGDSLRGCFYEASNAPERKLTVVASRAGYSEATLTVELEGPPCRLTASKDFVMGMSRASQ